MAGIAALILVIGFIVAAWGGILTYKAKRLSSAPFLKSHDVATKGATMAGPKGAVSVEGAVHCPQPLISPVTGTTCLYYKVKIVGSWKEGDTNKSKDYYLDEQAAGFAIDDGSGPVPIDARKGGDFELKKQFEKTPKEGFLADIKNALGKKEPIVFGNFAFNNPPMSAADKFTCTEHVLPMTPKLFVLGKHQEGVITSPSWTALILSDKGRDALVGATAKAARLSLIGGGAGLALGLILGLVSHFTAPKTAEAANAPEMACARTIACCRATHSPACDSFAHAPVDQCVRAIISYRRGIKANDQDAHAACD